MTDASTTTPAARPGVKPCAKCGVPVPSGYIRCPRCKAAIEGAVVPQNVARSSGSGWGWALIGSAALAAAGYIAWPYLRRLGGIAPTSTAAATDDSAAARAEAEAKLTKHLKTAAIEHNVKWRQDTLIVSSSRCSEPAIRHAIEETTALLSAAGAASVRCQDVSGEVISETPIE